jgi:hypothetical protein
MPVFWSDDCRTPAFQRIVNAVCRIVTVRTEKVADGSAETAVVMRVVAARAVGVFMIGRVESILLARMAVLVPGARSVRVSVRSAGPDVAAAPSG